MTQECIPLSFGPCFLQFLRLQEFISFTPLFIDYPWFWILLPPKGIGYIHTFKRTLFNLSNPAHNIQLNLLHFYLLEQFRFSLPNFIGLVCKVLFVCIRWLYTFLFFIFLFLTNFLSSIYLPEGIGYEVRSSELQ